MSRDTTPDNASKVYSALARFGVPLKDVTAADFATEDLLIRTKIASGRHIDLHDVEQLGKCGPGR